MKSDGDREKARLMMQTFDAMAVFTAPFVTAIYDVIDEKSGQLTGSGTFIELRGTPYILTAGHVAYEALTHRGLAHSTKDGTPPGFISNPLKLAGHPYDMGVVRLDQGALHGTSHTCVPSTLLAGDSSDVESDLLFVHGFPGQRSKPIALFQSVFSKTLPYGAVTSSSQYPWFDPALHIALDYSPAGMIDGGLNQPDFVEPFGLSGSALWKTNRAGTTSAEWRPESARIVGVLFAWDQKAHSLIAIRIEVIRDFLLRFLREEHAYFRWVGRGRPPGDDWSDWHAAVDVIPRLSPKEEQGMPSVDLTPFGIPRTIEGRLAAARQEGQRLLLLFNETHTDYGIIRQNLLNACVLIDGGFVGCVGVEGAFDQSERAVADIESESQHLFAKHGSDAAVIDFFILRAKEQDEKSPGRPHLSFANSLKILRPGTAIKCVEADELESEATETQFDIMIKHAEAKGVSLDQFSQWLREGSHEEVTGPAILEFRNHEVNKRRDQAFMESLLAFWQQAGAEHAAIFNAGTSHLDRLSSQLPPEIKYAQIAQIN